MKSSLSIPTCWTGRDNIKKMESGGSKGGKAVSLSTDQLKVAAGKAKVAITEMSDFFKLESFGMIIESRCGSCWKVSYSQIQILTQGGV